MSALSDVSANGATMFVIGMATFPVGFTVKSFPDDAEPWTIEEVSPVAFEPLATGGVAYYSQAVAVTVSVSVIAGSDDDLNFMSMLQAKMSMSNALPLPDITSIAINYPNGSNIVYYDGSIISGPLGVSAQATGRFKTNTYKFSFNGVKILNFTSVVSTLQTAAQFATLLF